MVEKSEASQITDTSMLPSLATVDPFTDDLRHVYDNPTVVTTPANQDGGENVGSAPFLEVCPEEISKSPREVETHTSFQRERSKKTANKIRVDCRSVPQNTTDDAKR